MRKKSNVMWWIEFAQVELNKCKKPTFNKWIAELDQKINGEGYTTWLSPRITPSDIYPIHDASRVIIDNLKQENAIEGHLQIQFKWEGFETFQWIDIEKNTENNWEDPDEVGSISDVLSYYPLIAAIIIKALKDEKITKNQLKKCEVCGNLMIQIGKQKKKYCSSTCRAKASKTKTKED